MSENQMRITEVELESADINQYDFLGCILNHTASEPFHLRHEYYEKEKDIVQSMYLFGRRVDERGTQVFVHKYFDYTANAAFETKLNFYKQQEARFKLPDNDKLTRTYILSDITGEESCNLFMTKDGKYRRRIVYEIKGAKNALLIVFSLDSNLFPGNQLFQFLKTNFKITIE